MAYSDKLKTALASINKNYGAGSVMNLNDEPLNVEVLCSTGSMTLNHAVGIGGYPKGRIIELYGPESSGKTTLCLHAIVEAQREGYTAAMIDVENAYDPTYGEALGVNHENLVFSQPDNGEQALDIIEALIDSLEIGLIICDSVAALVPRAELAGEAGDLKVGLHARLMSQAMRKFAAKCNKSGTTIIFTNQIREKIGVLYGNPEVTTGGNALKFYASIRLRINKVFVKDDPDGETSNKTKVKVIKNKVAPPFKEAYFDIVFGEGISLDSELINASLDIGLLIKAGSGILHDFATPLHPKEIPVGTTEAKAADALKSDKLFAPLKKEIMLRLDVATGKITLEEALKQLEAEYKVAEEGFAKYQEYWDKGSKASSSSKLVEAYYWLSLAKGANPFLTEAEKKFALIVKRIDEQKKKGKFHTDVEWLIDIDGTKINVLTGATE